MAVKVPRVRDRAPDGDGLKFTSTILPPYLRRAKSIEELLPWLYLKGISSGDFSEALAALLGPEVLEALAAEVGSDCPFFVRDQAAVMRGRGERLEVLPLAARAALAGRKVVLVKPPFGVPTPAAYALLAKAGKYRPAAQAEAELAAWIAQPAADPSAPGNDLAAPVFAKYLALPVGLESFRRATGVNWQMTGSGSACFAFVSDGFDHARLRADVRRAWGPGAWVEETVISA